MEIGKERIYNHEFKGRDDIIKWDVLNVEYGQSLKIKFISTNSINRQGIRLSIDYGKGYLEIYDIHNKGMIIWKDTSPKEFICKCFSEKGVISVYNIWDKGIGMQSLLMTSGMLIKTEGNVSTYYCNDFGFETNFDKLIFSIEKL